MSELNVKSEPLPQPVYTLIKPLDEDEWPGWVSELNPMVNCIFSFDKNIMKCTSSGKKWISVDDLIKYYIGEIDVKVKLDPIENIAVSDKWLIDVSEKLSLLL